MKKILISGVRGFIGKKLLDKFKSLNIPHKVADIVDFDDAVNLLNDFNINEYSIFCHLGASTSRHSENFKKIYNNNIKFNELIFSKLSKNKNLKIIFASANSICSSPSEKIINSNTLSSPNDFYSMSKLISEKILLNYHGQKNSFIIRMPSIYGYQSNNIRLLSHIATLAKANAKITLYNSKLRFNNALLIDDCINFYIKLILNIDKYNGSNVNLGTIDNYFFRDIVEKIIKILNSKSEVKFIEKNTGNYIVDISNAIKLGYNPSSLDDIIDSLKKY